MPAADTPENGIFTGNDGFSVDNADVPVRANFSTKATAIAFFLVDGNAA
jgi:hypothetical protein